MRSDEKVLISVYAAGEVGEHQLHYQLLHNLIFYLMEMEKVEFPNYSFSPFLWGEAGNALISRQLARDAGTLCAKWYFIREGSTVSISSLGIQAAQEIISGLSQEEASKLKRGVDSFLREMREDPKVCFQKCLRAYTASYAS